MSESQELKQDVRHLILPLRQMKTFCEKPIIIREAKGIYLTDVDGKRYIDGISGIFVAGIGHGNEEVLEAIRKQQERISFAPPLHVVTDTTVRYAKRLTQITPEGLDVVSLFSGGSEATESAMKFARQYHRQTGNPTRYKVVSVYKGYHGGTLGSLSASGLAGPRRSVFGPFLEGFVHIPPPTCFRCPYGLGYPACNITCARMLDTIIESEGPESIAAFIVEPIGNTGGIVTPPPEYLPIVREICTRHNVLLIYDEIITGMGRTGNWFAAQTFNTPPDILCAGKGMSGGYAPLAGMIVRSELHFGAFWGEESDNVHFAHAFTYSGNPISAAAGMAVIDVIEKNNLIANGRKIGDQIRLRVEKEIGELGILGEVRGKGALVGVEFVQDMHTKKPFPPERQFGKRVERRLLDAGLILRCDPNWIAFGPPFITTPAQADEMVDIFARCVADELKAS